MTLPLIKIADHDLQFNFDQLAKQFLDTGGRQIKLRVGRSNATWTAAVTSAGATVTHGLGSAPVAVFILSAPGGGATAEAMWRVTATSSTTFTCDGTRSAVFTGNTNFYWLAIG